MSRTPITPSLSAALERLENLVKNVGRPVPVEKWHGIPTEGKPDLVSIEVCDVTFTTAMPQDIEDLRAQCQPNLPWADDHFDERVSGEPLNPGRTYMDWPWYNPGSKWDQEFRASGKFTHTYMERFWPISASDKPIGPNEGIINYGIRYQYGDLNDLMWLLLREPYTRQAWLPVWFPEDTGAVHGGRVPCTIGYQFLMRDNRLHMWYVIRSCDVVRFMRDDVYMACRLAAWVLLRLGESYTTVSPFDWRPVRLGDFTFSCMSLHMFEGDRYAVSGDR